MTKKYSDPVQSKPAAPAPPVRPAPPKPDFWCFGVSRMGEGWVAVKLSNLGELVALSPRRNGEIHGEREDRALARMRATQERHHQDARRQKAGS